MKKAILLITLAVLLFTMAMGVSAVGYPTPYPEGFVKITEGEQDPALEVPTKNLEIDAALPSIFDFTGTGSDIKVTGRTPWGMYPSSSGNTYYLTSIQTGKWTVTDRTSSLVYGISFAHTESSKLASYYLLVQDDTIRLLKYDPQYNKFITAASHTVSSGCYPEIRSCEIRGIVIEGRHDNSIVMLRIASISKVTGEKVGAEQDLTWSCGGISRDKATEIGGFAYAFVVSDLFCTLCIQNFRPAVCNANNFFDSDEVNKLQDDYDRVLNDYWFEKATAENYLDEFNAFKEAAAAREQELLDEVAQKEKERKIIQESYDRYMDLSDGGRKSVVAGTIDMVGSKIWEGVSMIFGIEIFGISVGQVVATIALLMVIYFLLWLFLLRK